VTTFSEKPVQRIRKFVEKTLGEVRLVDINNRAEPDSDCTCPACANVSNVKKPLDIDRAVKIHEIFCGTKEFETGREAIRQEDMSAYVGSRKYLNQALSQPLA
jgi:queuine/archaeosine tRNA-ribosyltransferase